MKKKVINKKIFFFFFFFLLKYFNKNFFLLIFYFRFKFLFLFYFSLNFLVSYMNIFYLNIFKRFFKSIKSSDSYAFIYNSKELHTYLMKLTVDKKGYSICLNEEDLIL